MTVFEVTSIIKINVKEKGISRQVTFRIWLHNISHIIQKGEGFRKKTTEMSLCIYIEGERSERKFTKSLI